MIFKRVVVGMCIMASLALAGGVLAQDETAAGVNTVLLAEPAVPVWFWAVLAVASVAVVGASVALSLYVVNLRDRVPGWVTPFLPAAYSSASGAWDKGAAVMSQYAARTPSPADDEIVEIVDAQGRRLLVKVFGAVGYSPPAEASTSAGESPDVR